jgi:hypothetical protein
VLVCLDLAWISVSVQHRSAVVVHNGAGRLRGGLDLGVMLLVLVYLF